MKKSGFAAVNGTEIYYEVNGQGYPLVLLHSALMNHSMWDEQAKAFWADFQVIRYDLRGFGKTKMPVPASDLDDLKGLLEYLEIEKVYLLGLSYGGEIAMHFALEYPKMVEKLVLVSTGLDGYEYSEAAMQRWQTFIGLVQTRNFSEAIKVFIKENVDGPVAPADMVVCEQARKIMESYSFIHYLPSEEAIEEAMSDEAQNEDRPAIERLHEITMPTLVMAGEYAHPDDLKVAEVLTQKISNVKQVVIPKASHLINLRQPMAFNQTVRDFLK